MLCKCIYSERPGMDPLGGPCRDCGGTRVAHCCEGTQQTPVDDVIESAVAKMSKEELAFYFWIRRPN